MRFVLLRGVGLRLERVPGWGGIWQPEIAAGPILLVLIGSGLLLQPPFPGAADLLLEGLRLCGEVVLHQQVLGQGEQQAIGGGAEPGFQHGFEVVFFAPQAAQN